MQGLEILYLGLKESLLDDMPKEEFIDWLHHDASGIRREEPNKQFLLDCLPWCNAEQEKIVYSFLNKKS